MAERTFNTRFQLKYDTWAEWTKNNPVLKKGEVAIVEVPVDAKRDETNNVVPQQPVILMKIGDGTTEFNNLDWTAAKAADVYDWAKTPEKPEYKADEIDGINAYIEKYVGTDMGISVDTDTQYTIVPVEGNAYKYELKSKSKEESDFTSHVAFIEIPKYDDSSIAGRVEAVEGLVGETSVQAQIAAYVEALKLGETYASKTAFEELQRKFNTVDGDAETDGSFRKAIADAEKNIKETTDDLDERIDALETGKQDTIVWQNNNYDKDTNKAVTKSDLDAAVFDLTGAMHFKGVEEALPEGEALDEYTNGDVIIVGTKEYVFGEDGEFHEFGDESVYAVKGNIKNADIADDAAIAQTKIAGLKDTLVNLGTKDLELDNRLKELEGKEENWDEAVAKEHTHENKELLDTYDQTNADIKDAVDKKHEHENADVLAGITAEKVNAWDVAEQNAKDHADEKVEELNDSLATIAKTGNVNDLIQTEGDVLVFYSGTSSTVM